MSRPKQADTPFPHLPVIFRILSLFDSIVACGCLAAMLLVGLMQIFLRNFFQTGIVGADELVRHLTLLLVFTGAGLAAQSDGHIRIDVLPRLLPDRIKSRISGAVYFFAGSICAILAFVSTDFMLGEMETGAALPGFNIPVWLFQAIIPIGYTTLGIRFFVQGIFCLLGHRKAYQ